MYTQTLKPHCPADIRELLPRALAVGIIDMNASPSQSHTLAHTWVDQE